MTRILFLGPWGPPFLAAARSAKRQGLSVSLLEPTPCHSNWRRLSACLDDGAVVERELLGTPEGLKAVVGHVISSGASALICKNDAWMLWLSQNRHAFEPSCKLLMPTFETLAFVASKRNQIQLAADVGFDVLPTFYLTCPSDADAVPEELFPLALRPDQERELKPYFKVQLVESRPQLRAFLQGMEFIRAPVIGQPFRSLPNLVVHGARTEDGRFLGLQAFLVARKFEGVTLSAAPVKTPPSVEQSCRAFAEQIGLTGCFHFELLLSAIDQRAWFLEVNVRLGGTTDKVRRLGFDEPQLLYQSYGIGAPATDMPAPRRRLVVTKRALLKHILWALRGRLTALDYPSASRFHHVLYSCRDLLLAEDSIFDPSDLRGSLWYYTQ